MLSYRIDLLARTIANKEGLDKDILVTELSDMSVTQIDYLEDKYDTELAYIFQNRIVC